jgi:hypothetical protein
MIELSDQYCAGFFDGEGSVYAATRRKESPTIVVCISNTNLEVLEYHETKWGGSIHARKRNNLCWQQQYQWVLNAKGAFRFLTAIQPYSIVKRKIINVALEYCRLMAETPIAERVDYTHLVFRKGRYWVFPIVKPWFREAAIRLHGRIRELNTQSAPKNARRAYAA